MQPSSPRLDPAPLWLLKSFLDVLATTLLSGLVPANWSLDLARDASTSELVLKLTYNYVTSTKK